MTLPLVPVLPPPLTGSLHKGHRHRLLPRHALLSPFLSRLDGLSVLTLWAYPCVPAYLTSPPPPLGFLLCWLLGLFPLRSEKLFSLYCDFTFLC